MSDPLVFFTRLDSDERLIELYRHIWEAMRHVWPDAHWPGDEQHLAGIESRL